MARRLAKYVACGVEGLKGAACFHYIASHNISVKQVVSSNEQFDGLLTELSHDKVLLIDKLTPLTREYKDNLATCLEDGSDLTSFTTTEISYGKDLISEYRYNGQISLLSEETDISSSENKLLTVTYAVKNIGGTSEMCAAVHSPEITKHALTHLLGGISFSDSIVRTSGFHGFSGTAWTVQNMHQDPVSGVKSSKESDSVLNRTELEILDNNLEYDNGLEGITGNLDGQLSASYVEEVANVTKDQNSSDVWRALRKKRLTASLFGIVINAIDRGKFPPSLFKQLTGGYDISGVPAIQWGNEHEDSAKEDYQNITGNKVEDTGLWLHSSGILGASPDGLLSDGEGLVEFKCPYTLRHISIEEAVESGKSFYLNKDEQGKIKLDKKHSYYHQVQGMLYLINRSYCDFVVWSPVGGGLITRVEKDPDWEENIAKLINFYFKQFLPKLLETEDEKCLYDGYIEVLNKVGTALEDNKQKRVERKQSLKQNRADVKQGKELVPKVLQSDLTSTSQQDLFKVSFDDSLRISGITAPLGSKHVFPPLWYSMKEHRLTSSHFGFVLAAIKRDRFPLSLFKKVMGEYYGKNTTYFKWAAKQELTAIERYEQQSNMSVIPSGIWLDNSGVLGASVNGLLPDQEGIVEIRCPYKFKALELGEILDNNDKAFFLERTDEGLKVKRGAELYDQIQGAMYFSQRQYCDVIVMTLKSFEVVRQYRDPEWESKLDCLRRFYFEKMFPRLCEKWGEENVVRDLQRFSAE